MMDPIRSPANRCSGSASQDVASTIPTTPDDDLCSKFKSLGELETAGVRNICCIGAGYVGGPTAAVIAYNHPEIRVTVVDQNAQQIRRWNSRHLPIYEPDLHDIVRVARDGSKAFAFLNVARTLPDANWSGPTSYHDPVQPYWWPRYTHASAFGVIPSRKPNLFFSVNVREYVAEADIVFIVVNTPTKSSGVAAGSATDMAAFEAAVTEVVQYARPGTIIVEKSTVPCKTAQRIEHIAGVYRPGVHFEVLSNPEFLAAGTAVNDLMYPDRIIIGHAPTRFGSRAAHILARMYARSVPYERIIMTNLWSSELSKLVANSFLAQRISSINSISAICEETGADVDEVVTAIGSDSRIGSQFLNAGIGFGGSCLKKDIMSLVYLADSLGLNDVGEYWGQVVKMNEYQRDRFSRRVIRCLNNSLVTKKITFLGYAFKANTSDTRESPTLGIIKTLLEEMPAEIAIFDPCCNPAVISQEIETFLKDLNGRYTGLSNIVVYSNVYDACASSHAILVTTACEEFRTAEPQVPLLRDPRPFDRFVLSETNIFALHKFLLQLPRIPMPQKGDPLGRFEKEPSCVENCVKCETIHTVRERIDWRKISHGMETPKWLFDGKGIISIEKMERLGVHVESIGRQGK